MSAARAALWRRAEVTRADEGTFRWTRGAWAWAESAWAVVLKEVEPSRAEAARPESSRPELCRLDQTISGAGAGLYVAAPGCELILS
jgi:hypothetical protein